MSRLLALLMFATPLMAQSPPSPTDPFAKWEKSIAAIEKRLMENPPKKGGIVFIGSSSIRLWSIDESFPGRNAVNVGFGGSIIEDSTHFAPRILIPLEPKTVVLYAGDNDIARNRTPKQLQDDFQKFVTLIHTKLPKTRILYIPVKPSVRRWDQYETQTKANAAIRSVCENDKLLTYVDIVPAMLGTDGKPKPEFFAADGLHMSKKGYAIWNQAVNAALEASPR